MYGIVLLLLTLSRTVLGDIFTYFLKTDIANDQYWFLRWGDVLTL